MKVYLRLLEDGTFTTPIEGINEILESDIEISLEDYLEYFNTKDTLKYYRRKEIPTGNQFFDYIEEYLPERINVPTTEDRVEVMEKAMLEVLECLNS